MAALPVKVGVFDSGMGGLSVANAIAAALPDLEVVYREDRENVPYGTRPASELLELVVPIFERMIDEGCAVIVVACNTVTTTIITDLRRRFEVPLVGIEPMVKPAAAMTKTGVIAVCATPTTLSSPRYRELKDMYARDIRVVEPDCSDWARMIESDQIDQEQVATRLFEALDAGADVIVLACTHYHWIREEILGMARGRAQVIQPEPAIISRLKQVLGEI